MLMAILVMTVGLLGMLQAIIVAYDQKASNTLRDESYRVAERELNQWQVLTFNNITGTPKETQASSDAFPELSNPFTVTRSFTQAGESKKLSVMVQWKYKGKGPVQHEVFTVKSR